MNKEEQERTLGILSKYWLSKPELRLGQIISNAFHRARMNGGADDLFYLADKDLVKAIELLDAEN